MLKYAGVDIGGTHDPDGRLEEELARLWHADGIRDYTHPAHNVSGIDHLPIPAQPDVQPPKLNTLVWPNGASRWGEFHTFVTKSQLDAIYKQINPGSPTSAKLEILPAADKDQLGLNLKVQPEMYMLPPRVICRHAGGELYLLSLVDQRFYWWQKVASVPSVPAALASWGALLQDLMASVGEPGAAIEAVSANYGTPDADRWTVGYKPLPLLIDAACKTVGMRLVLQIGGTDVVIRSHLAASAVLETAWGVYKDEVLTGGRLTLEDMAIGLPEKVIVVFPGDTPNTKEYLLEAEGTAWGEDYTGVIGAVAFIGADMPATAADADRQIYGNEAAGDFYGWCNSPVDATFRGLAGWAPTGLEDRIEWVHERNRVVTRVYRLPSHDRNLYLGDNCCGGADVECVRVTSLTATDGRYPGKIQDYDVEAKTWSDRTGGDCWVVGKNGRALQLLRYEDAKSRGTLAADSKPVYAVWEGLGSGSSAAVPCKNLGWLRSGPRSNKAWKVSVVEAMGECDCTPLTATGDELYALYNATDSSAGIDVWDVIGNIITCCGCATAQIKVTHATRLAQLILTYKSCDDGSTQTVTIDAECGGDGYVVFDVYKEDLCDPPSPAGNYSCTSLFRVKAECVDCDLANAECALCATDKGPAVWKVIGSGFSDDHSDYNGTWFLTSTSACAWSITCGGVTVTLALSDVNPSSPSSGLRYTLTFSGAAGGSVVYKLDDTDRACDQNHTLSLDSGDSLESPATVDILPIVCVPLEDYCQQLIDEGATFTATITNKTGLCTCVGDSYGPFVYDSTLGEWHTGTTGDPLEFGCNVLDCEENAEIIITCTNGQLQFGAGGAQTLVSYTRNPFLWVADKSIDAGNGPGGYRVTITKN